MPERVGKEFFARDAVEVAPDLLGVFICRKFDDGEIGRYQILETEAYFGEEDRGNAATKGRTPFCDMMYAEGGRLFIFLIYGMYWMVNIVTGPVDHPEAVLVRVVTDAPGPGKCGSILRVDKSFSGEDLGSSERIWLEDSGVRLPYKTAPRVGLKRVAQPWRDKPWRFIHSPAD
jgi:DNA-3-methyladenine glycosylase